MKTDITIVVLNDYCTINGGASRVAIDEAVALDRAGLRVIFLGAVGPVGEDLRHSGVETHCLGQAELLQAGFRPGVAVQGLWNFAAAREMDKILGGLDPARTIVHLHGYTKALSTSPVRRAVKRGFAVVCTLHDFFVACPNGAFFDYRKSTPCELRALSPACVATHCDKRAYAHKLYRVARVLSQRGAGLLPSGVRHFIRLSRRSGEILADYLPVAARLHDLENIIGVERNPPARPEANSAVVAVGRLDPEKGCELLMQAARQAGTPVTFVGDGPQRAMLEAGGCRVTGWLSPAGVEAELERARAIVFPSLWYETYGLVVSEAAARGIPAVVSDVSAAAERVRHGETGLVFPSGDVSALARSLALLSEDGAVATMGAAAYRAFWKNPPTRARHVAGLLDIYAEILGLEQGTILNTTAERMDA